MNVAMRGFAERDDAGIETVDESAQRNDIESAGGGNAQFGTHSFSFRRWIMV
jgi:hypothetical protein